MRMAHMSGMALLQPSTEWPSWVGIDDKPLSLSLFLGYYIVKLLPLFDDIEYVRFDFWLASLTLIFPASRSSGMYLARELRTRVRSGLTLFGDGPSEYTVIKEKNVWCQPCFGLQASQSSGWFVSHTARASIDSSFCQFSHFCTCKLETGFLSVDGGEREREGRSIEAELRKVPKKVRAFDSRTNENRQVTFQFASRSLLMEQKKIKTIISDSLSMIWWSCDQDFVWFTHIVLHVWKCRRSKFITCLLQRFLRNCWRYCQM